MSDTELDGLDEFTGQVAEQIESFLIALGAVARGDQPESALSILLLEVSQLMLAGGRLGAIVDVVPVERFEPDAGLDPDADELRARLAQLLAGVDEYLEVFDPYDRAAEIEVSRLSDDLADVAADLYHGLAHFRAGRQTEALWWWQYSYLANWGSTASSALRALHSAIAHTRLDVEEPVS
ncbi:MAG: DUF5063 domain-containing protein [Actinomycetota bacterium]|nr:DUF5063 domain-containing protein [Actinomycetota bacterium]MDH4353669.1 DUF5063 domain-containing protein [Actinomycetota bacterium]